MHPFNYREATSGHQSTDRSYYRLATVGYESTDLWSKDEKLIDISIVNNCQEQQLPHNVEHMLSIYCVFTDVLKCILKCGNGAQLREWGFISETWIFDIQNFDSVLLFRIAGSSSRIVDDAMRRIIEGIANSLISACRIENLFSIHQMFCNSILLHFKLWIHSSNYFHLSCFTNKRQHLFRYHWHLWDEIIFSFIDCILD